ncbi:hypothetical protein Tco_1072563 [Tanacetum coccineum]
MRLLHVPWPKMILSILLRNMGGEASVPLFKAFFTVGPAGDWLTFQKRSGSDIRPLFGSFAYPYPKDPFDEALWNRLRCHTFEAQTFIEPILYLVGLSSSWDHASSNPSIFVDGEEIAFRNFIKKPGQNPSFSVRSTDQTVDVGIPGQSASVAGEGSMRRRSIIESLKKEAIMVKIMPKKKKLEVPRRMSTRGNVSSPPATVPKGIGKHPWVLAHFVGSLANSSDSLAPGMLFSLCLSLLSSFHLVCLSYDVSFSNVKEAHAAHNMISSLHCPLLKDKLGFLSFNELVDVFDVHALQTTVVGNMLTNESCILSQGHVKLKNDLVSLKSKKSSLEHEMSKLKDHLEKAQRK